MPLRRPELGIRRRDLTLGESGRDTSAADPSGFLIETSCGTSRSLSPLRSHEAMGMLGAQEVMMQVSDPLSAGNRHIQIFYAILDVR